MMNLGPPANWMEEEEDEEKSKNWVKIVVLENKKEHFLGKKSLEVSL